MPRPFRLAIAGAGMITRESHLPAALTSPRVEVVAIVEPVRRRAEELVRACNIAPKIVPKVQDVLGEVDGVIIATPNDTHKSIALAGLEAGVPVLIEKPLASTLAEGELIVRTAKQRGIVLAVGYVTRFRENVLFLRELLRKNYFGATKRFAYQFGTSGGWAPMSSYNLSRAATGGGVLVVTGTHFLDRMVNFWGYPQAMEYFDDSQGGPEANCRAAFHYRTDGFTFEGFLILSKTSRLPGGLVIETDQGTVELAETSEADIIFYPRRDQNVRQIVRRSASPVFDSRMGDFERQLEDFVTACQQGHPPLVDGDQGLASLRLIEQLYAGRQMLTGLWARPA